MNIFLIVVLFIIACILFYTIPIIIQAKKIQKIAPNATSVPYTTSITTYNPII